MGLFEKKDFDNLGEYGKKTYKDNSEFEEDGRKALGTTNDKRVQLQDEIKNVLGVGYKVESTNNQISTKAKTFFDYQWFRIIVDGVDENVFFTFSINCSGIRLTVDSKENKDNYRKKNVEGAEDLHNRIAEKYDVTTAIEKELKQWCEIIRTYIQAHLDDLKSFAILFAKKEKNVVGGHSSLESENPLNQILFGPPGTGKTYNTIFKTLDVLGEPAVKTNGNPTAPKTVWFENEDADRDKALELFNQYKKEGRIVFTTFHQSMSYEDFIEGIKPQTDENGQVIYKVEDGIFKDICTITAQKVADGYDQLVADILNGNISNISLPSGKSSSTMGVTTNGHINFKRKDGSDGDTTSKDRIIDMYKEEPDYEKALQHDYGHKGNDTNHIAVLRYIWEKLLSKKVLIIDEINRGNVANIFGELITLIEDDKRLGNSEAMTCTLPYSKKEFGVPNNLYIIGTMNTADRSVEALDSALRRRFSFVEMMPKPELLEGISINGFNNATLKDLLEVINKRIEVLKDREHQIGHSYFMKYAKENEIEAEALKKVFTDKIIPLLQEYFYGDYEKIQLVLGNGFVEEDNNEVPFAGKTLYDDIPEKRYKIVEPKDMQQALATLLNIPLIQREEGTSDQSENTDEA